jgi:hypothetical protein
MKKDKGSGRSIVIGNSGLRNCDACENICQLGWEDGVNCEKAICWAVSMLCRISRSMGCEETFKIGERKIQEVYKRSADKNILPLLLLSLNAIYLLASIKHGLSTILLLTFCLTCVDTRSNVLYPSTSTGAQIIQRD